MSAWIVTREHVAVLVNALSQFGVEAGGSLESVGQLLWHECHLSVNYRYDEHTPTPGYVHIPAAEPLHPVAALKAADCYDYQSCEHPGWRESRACRLTAALNVAIVRAHPAATP